MIYKEESKKVLRKTTPYPNYI